MAEKQCRTALVTALLAAVIFSSWSGPCPAEKGLDGMLAEVRERYGTAGGVKIPYTREVISRSMAMMGSELRGDLASGTIYFKPPRYLRLEQETPRREILTTDGTTLWWYIPEEKQVHRYAYETFGRELELLSHLFQGFSRSGQAFQLTVLEPAAPGERRIQLRPDPPWDQVDRILVTLTQAHDIREVEIHNPLGGITRFELQGAVKAPRLEPEDFRFQVPDDVTVVTGDR